MTETHGSTSDKAGGSTPKREARAAHEGLQPSSTKYLVDKKILDFLKTIKEYWYWYWFWYCVNTSTLMRHIVQKSSSADGDQPKTWVETELPTLHTVLPGEAVLLGSDPVHVPSYVTTGGSVCQGGNIWHNLADLLADVLHGPC